MDNPLTRFGRELAGARGARGLSQAALAKGARKKQPDIAKLEAGEVDARLSTLQGLAGALGAAIVIEPSGDIRFERITK